jgi:hypothetical protein
MPVRLRWQRPLILAAALAVSLGGGPAAAGVADRVGATFGLMLQDVVSRFPAVEGIVVAVEADRLYMDLAAKDGVQVGQEFLVFRKGDVFHHPLTQRPLGRYEEHLGWARVVRVFPEFSECEFVARDGAPTPEPEDGVRITRGRIRVAVAPPVDLTRGGADLRRVPFMIALALDRSKRFQSADPGAVQDLFAGRATRVEELLVRPRRAVALGKAVGVTGWVVPVVLERGGVQYLDVTWVSAVTGAPLFSRRMPLTRAGAAAEQRFPWEPVPAD